MPTFNEELTVERTGNWNSPTPTLGSESLVVSHSENGVAPAVTFANLGGGHFVQQFTFGANANLPGGVAANFSADWSGLTITGQQAVAFHVGELSSVPITQGEGFSFSGADVVMSGNLFIGGTISPLITKVGTVRILAFEDLIVSNLLEVNELVAKQIRGPGIDSLQSSLDSLQSSIKSVQQNQGGVQSAIQQILADINALQSEIVNLQHAVAIVQQGS